MIILKYNIHLKGVTVMDITDGGRVKTSKVTVRNGETKYLDLSEGLAMSIYGDGKIEEPILTNIRDRFSKDEFFKPALKELITDISDKRIPMFIQSPLSLKDTLGSSWENFAVYKTSGDGYEFVVRPMRKLLDNGPVISHHLVVNTQDHTVRISMYNRKKEVAIYQSIEAEYDPKTLKVKPETIQESVSS